MFCITAILAEDYITAILAEDYITAVRNKRPIRPRTIKDHKNQIIVTSPVYKKQLAQL